jgi:hypothetical protein
VSLRSGLGWAWDTVFGAFRRSETDLRQYRDSLEPTSNGSGFSLPRFDALSDRASTKSVHFCSHVPVSAAHAHQQGLMFRHVRRLLAAAVNFMRRYKLLLSQADYFPFHPSAS